MPTRPSALLALLVAVGFAGCTSGDGGEGTNVDPGLVPGPDAGLDVVNNTTADGAVTAASVARLVAGRCSIWWGVFPTPASALAGRTPSGFRTQPMGADAVAAAYMLGFSCGNATANGTEVAGPLMFFEGFAVEPPAELRNESAFSDVVGTFLSPTPEVAGVLRAWGLGGPGTVTASTNAFVGQWRAAANGTSYDLAVATSSSQDAAGFASGSALRFFVVREGQATAVVTMAAPRFPAAVGGAQYVSSNAPVPFSVPSRPGLGFIWGPLDAAWTFESLVET